MPMLGARWRLVLATTSQSVSISAPPPSLVAADDNGRVTARAVRLAHRWRCRLTGWSTTPTKRGAGTIGSTDRLVGPDTRAFAAAMVIADRRRSCWPADHPGCCTVRRQGSHRTPGGTGAVAPSVGETAEFLLISAGCAGYWPRRRWPIILSGEAVIDYATCRHDSPVVRRTDGNATACATAVRPLTGCRGWRRSRSGSGRCAARAGGRRVDALCEQIRPAPTATGRRVGAMRRHLIRTTISAARQRQFVDHPAYGTGQEPDRRPATLVGCSSTADRVIDRAIQR